MLIFLFILIVSAANENGKRNHTKIYEYELQKNNGTINNINDFWFISKTFLQSDICQPIENRYEYVKILINNNISCANDRCPNNSWNCKNYCRQGYQMEHIIDKNNADILLKNCSTNILGNLIMAYGIWNMQMGALNWAAVMGEKMDIYGDIFADAYSNVRKCCFSKQQKTFNYPLLIVVIFTSFIINFTIYRLKKKNDKHRMYDENIYIELKEIEW